MTSYCAHVRVLTLLHFDERVVAVTKLCKREDTCLFLARRANHTNALPSFDLSGHYHTRNSNSSAFQEGAVNHLTRRGSSVTPGASNTDSLLTVLIQELDNCNRLLEVGSRPLSAMKRQPSLYAIPFHYCKACPTLFPSNVSPKGRGMQF